MSQQSKPGLPKAIPTAIVAPLTIGPEAGLEWLALRMKQESDCISEGTENVYKPHMTVKTSRKMNTAKWLLEKLTLNVNQHTMLYC